MTDEWWLLEQVDIHKEKHPSINSLIHDRIVTYPRCVRSLGLIIDKIVLCTYVEVYACKWGIVCAGWFSPRCSSQSVALTRTAARAAAAAVPHGRRAAALARRDYIFHLLTSALLTWTHSEIYVAVTDALETNVSMYEARQHRLDINLSIFRSKLWTQLQKLHKIVLFQTRIIR